MEEQVIISAEEHAEFEAFKAEKAKKEASEKAKNDREAYRALVDETINRVFPQLQAISRQLAQEKTACIDAFRGAMEMKEGMFKVRDDQRSHTFTNSEQTFRIILGFYTTDNYRDTVDDGIAIIKDVIVLLAKDNESKILVNAVLKLLSRDKQGNLKASRVLQLRKMAEELGNERFAEGVRIIEESYLADRSKEFVRAEYKNKYGKWVNVPLGMTEA